MERLCKKICPLPNDCENVVDKIDEDPSFRRRDVIQNGEKIGYVSVLITTDDLGIYPKKIMTNSEKDVLAKNGILVDDSAVACRDMTEHYEYVLRKDGGAMGGGVRCNHTNKVSYGSGISTLKR